MGISEPTPAAVEVERCTECLLPKTDAIYFDENGVCGVCLSQKDEKVEKVDEAARAAELEKLVESIKERGKGHDYDCLVGLSGGRDSSYLISLLVRKHNLRCLAAYYRAPFTPDLIDENVKRISKNLDVPLVEMDISQEYHRKMARKIVLFWKKNPAYSVANLTCAPCKLVNREVFKIAKKYDIPSIIYGGSKYEAFALAAGAAPTNTNPKNVHSFGMSLRKMWLIIKRGVGSLFKYPALVQFLPIGISASILYINPHTPYLQLRYPDISALDYFQLGEWDEADIIKTLDEIGWELPPTCNSYYKADCTYAECKNVMFTQMAGVNYMDAHISNMVRAGVISKEEGMRRYKEENVTSMERLQEACDTLEVPLSTILP